MFDALLKLSKYNSLLQNDKDKKDILKALYNSVSLIKEELIDMMILQKISNIYHMTLIEIFDAFKNRLQVAYKNNKH